MRASCQVRRAAIRRAIKEHQEPGHALYKEGYEAGMQEGIRLGREEGAKAAFAAAEEHINRLIQSQGHMPGPQSSILLPAGGALLTPEQAKERGII